MKAIFINVTEKTVTEIKVKNSLKAFYERLQCGMIQVVPLGQKQLMIVDEEGKLKRNPPGYFRFTNNPMTLAGHTLIVSEKGEDFGDVRVLAERIRSMIEFLDLTEAERPKPRIAFAPIDDLTSEGIAKARNEALKKLTDDKE